MIKSVMNPWAGLASYEDPQNAEYDLKFCGRDDDSYDVARLIMGNVFVTLYGKSGIGKTSLLNAGVFPELREDGFTPISVRLGIRDEKNPKSFQRIIIDAVEQVIKNCDVIEVVPEQCDQTSKDFLWNYFARHRFCDTNKKQTIPVIVLDQFEEVFRKDRDEAEILLRQLDYLNDKDHALDACEVNGLAYRYEQNFRFTVSIREDDLYRLEDSLDNCYLPALKRNRYRLRSLSEEDAQKVILIPGEGLFRPEEQDDIVKRVIEATRQKGDDSISTNLLSLICNRLYNDCKNAGSEYISGSFVESFMKGNPIDRFYNEATKGFSDKEKEYIENHLVDSNGRRNSISESDFKKNVPGGQKLLEGNSRILQRTSTSSDGASYRVELIHDSFCEVLVENRNERNAKEQFKRKKRRYIVALSSILFIVLVYLFYLHVINSIKDENTRNSILYIAEASLSNDDVLGAVNALQFLNGDNCFNSLSDNMQDIFYRVDSRLKSQTLLSNLKPASGQLGTFELVPEKNLLIVSSTNYLYIWDYSKSLLCKTFIYDSYVQTIDVDARAGLLLVTLMDDKLRVYNLSDLSEVYSANGVFSAIFNTSNQPEILILTSQNILKRVESCSFQTRDSIIVNNLGLSFVDFLYHHMLDSDPDSPMSKRTNLGTRKLFCSPSGERLCINYASKHIVCDLSDSIKIIGEFNSEGLSKQIEWDSENKVLSMLNDELTIYDIERNEVSIRYPNNDDLALIDAEESKLVLAKDSNWVYCLDSDLLPIDSLLFQDSKIIDVDVQTNSIVTSFNGRIRISDFNENEYAQYDCTGAKHVLIDTNFVIVLRNDDVLLYNLPDSSLLYREYVFKNLSEIVTTSSVSAFVDHDNMWKVGTIDVNNGNCVYPLYESIDKIEKISLSSDGEYLLFTSQDTCVNVISIESGNIYNTFTYESSILEYMSCDELLFTLTCDGALHINNYINNKEVKTTYNGKKYFAKDIDMSRDGNLLTIRRDLNDTSVIDFYNKNIMGLYRPLYSKVVPGNDNMFCLDNNHIIYNRKSIWEIHDLDSRELICTSDAFAVPCLDKKLLIAIPGYRYNLTYSSNADSKIYRGLFNYINVYELDTGLLKYKLKHHEAIRSYEISLDENILVSSTDNRLYFWSLISGELLYLINFKERIESFDLSKDGEYVAAYTATSLRIIPFDIEEIISRISHKN